MTSLSGAETTFGAIGFTLPAVATLVASLYVPARSTISEVLSVLPVSRGSVQVAGSALGGCIGFGMGACMLAPVWLPLLYSRGVEAIPSVLLLGWCSVLGVLVAVAGAALLGLLLRAIRVGSVVSQGLAALAVAVVTATAFTAAMPVNGNTPGGFHAWSTGRALEVAGGAEIVGLLPSILTFVLGILVVGLVSRVAPTDTSRAAYFPTSALWRARTLIGFELVQILRFPANAMLLVFINGAAVLTGLVLVRSGQQDPSLGILILTMTSAWGVGIYGPTRKHHWIYRTTARPHAWVLPKVAAALVIWMVMTTVHGTWLVLATDLAVRDLLLMVPTLLVELLIACSVGVCLPVGNETSVSGALSEAVAMILIVSVGTGIQAVTSRLGTETQVLALYAGILAVASLLYVVVARRSAVLG